MNTMSWIKFQKCCMFFRSEIGDTCVSLLSQVLCLKHQINERESQVFKSLKLSKVMVNFHVIICFYPSEHWCVFMHCILSAFQIHRDSNPILLQLYPSRKCFVEKKGGKKEGKLTRPVARVRDSWDGVSNLYNIWLKTQSSQKCLPEFD